ncbi:P-loop containing nucleoside triphosphate hydrolase protein [Mycena galericulata]|nr:P-loop containing nucleoside triphosphate hydrolase protein [Mycena galericulata]
MVRRVDTSDEDNATPSPQKMNGGVKVKAEKVKGKGKEKAAEELEDGSPKGAKRARVNDEGDSVPRDEDEEGDDEEEQEQEEESAKRGKTKTLPRDVDGFIPGSIVRIQLRNFVTYDAVEFRPGAFLNMILGPNGTGKSSIACAICLGLNFPPATLGRASELGSFVKIGASTAHIEIELKSPAGETNLVVRRNLTAGSKSSTFTLNGAQASGKEVTARVGRLNVQVGNLCSFLPQDKVSAFASMSPTELLCETQRAAGDPRLEAWHKSLVSEGQELRKINADIASESATMHQLKERNEGIERDVQRYRERKKIEHTIALLRVLIPVQAYREARITFLALKERQRAQHLRVSRLQERNKPAHALLAKLDNQHNELHADREAAKKVLRAALARVQHKSSAAELLENESEDIQNKLQNLKKAEKQRLASIKNCEATITELQEKIDEALEVKMESEEDVRAEWRRLQMEHDASGLAAEKRAWEQKSKDLKARQDRNSRETDAGKRELKSLDDADAVKLRNLTQWDRDVGETVRWLRENKDKFRMEVFEPPCAIPAVENSFNQSQMKMFVCQCKEDYDTLNHCINDNPGLGHKARVPTWFRPGDENDLVLPPMERDELNGRGFDGYAIEYVECPDGLRWYLKKELNMHRTAISLRGIKDLQGAIAAVGRPGANGRTTNTNFIDQRTVHQVQRSKYGKRELMASANSVPEARNFGGRAQVNPAEKQRIDDILARCQRELADIREAERELSTEHKRIAEIDKAQKAALDLAREVIDEQMKVTTLGLEFLQVGAKKTALKDLCDRKDAKYQIALAEFNKIDAEFVKMKETTRKLLAESKELLSELPDELREEYQETESARPPAPGDGVDLRTMDELQTELEKQEANLEMNMNTNPGCRRTIEQHEKAIDSMQRNADKIDRRIKTARANWEPALQSLVTSIGKKFSAAFDRIGCAGEIRVRREEAYENWAIDILVKFRDTENLQLLTGQRQSGGERSLTTILYLMSLTEEARAPFSLVDEINQGMDQRAERMVHNSMVEVTCKEDSAQYFLITPKLLPDLEYHHRMKILCVNNGEWLPDESGLGNMMNMLDGYVAKNPGRS